MADESVLAIEEFSKLDYSLKQYLIYAKIIQEKVKQLNKKGMHKIICSTYISLQEPIYSSECKNDDSPN